MAQVATAQVASDKGGQHVIPQLGHAIAVSLVSGVRQQGIGKARQHHVIKEGSILVCSTCNRQGIKQMRDISGFQQLPKHMTS